MDEIEITLEMSTAGSLALSRIKDDVADGSMSLRDAVEMIFRAMLETHASARSEATSSAQFRRVFSSSVFQEMSQTPLHPELDSSVGEKEQHGPFQIQLDPMSRVR